MKNKIQIEGLSIGYEKEIITDINISFDENELIAIIGRNGSGKSTLIKTLCSLIPKIKGSFKVQNKNILNLKETERAKLLSVVTTKPTDIYNITVYEYISFGRYPYNNWLGIIKNNGRKIVNKAIEDCNLNELSLRLYETLSDGEKQRVNIARAIAQETPLIILDEPTAHLDLINKIEVFKLLQQLTKEHNKTIIFSTHHIEYALQVCDSIWTINNNELKKNTPKTLIESNLINTIITSDKINFDKDSMTFKIS